MKPANIMLFGMMLASLSSAQAGAAAGTDNADVRAPQPQIHTPSLDDASDSGSSLLLLEEEKEKE